MALRLAKKDSFATATFRKGAFMPPFLPSWVVTMLREMRVLRKYLLRFYSSTSGATAIEYGIICALLAVSVLAAMGFLNGPVGGLFGSIPQYFAAISFE